MGVKELELLFLGTGYSQALNNYNACFLIRHFDSYLLVDGGGGNGILKQLHKANITLENINHIFLSHSHMDHMTGIIWLIKEIIRKLKADRYQENLFIYCSGSTKENLIKACEVLIGSEVDIYFNNRIFIKEIKSGSKERIIGLDFTFIDLKAKKVPLFGFIIENNHKKLIFTGDEKIKKSLFPVIKNCDYLISESLCSEKDKDIFKPNKSFQSTVKEVAILANKLNIKHLILFHTEDINPLSRVNIYIKEAQEYFHNKVYIPEDFEQLRIRL